jgi:hypothetical protein
LCFFFFLIVFFFFCFFLFVVIFAVFSFINCLLHNHQNFLIFNCFQLH